MTEKFGDSSEGKTKDCFVLLERLDVKMLDRCLGRNLKTHSSRNVTCTATVKKKSDQVRRLQNRRKRKRKIKPLCYTDDEDDSTVMNPLKCESVSSANTDPRATEERKSEQKDISCDVEMTVEGRKDETPVEHGDSDRAATGCCSAVDSEVEIINEFPKRGNVFCDKTICDVKFINHNESVQPEVEDEEDLREEGEDDRNTVVFEMETDLQVLEFDEKKIGEKFRKKKITNRKKRRLVKFKRKSMSGRKLGKIRKSKRRFLENVGAAQDGLEKCLTDCISEDCLKELCISVRRLHEMYTIILQLQREIPKDPELSIHFKRVINVQEENFHREIRRTQKPIIKSFEKMLKPCGNSLDKVAKELGRRTYLSAEEVIYVLSLCILVEGSCDADKTKSGSAEKTEQSKCSPNKPRQLRVTKKAAPADPPKPKTSPQEAVDTVESGEAPAPRPCLPPVGVGHQPGPPHPQVPATLAPTSKGQRLQPGHDPVEKYNERCPWGQQNFENAPHCDVRMRQFRETNPRPQVVRRPPSSWPPNTVPNGYNVPYPNLNWPCLPGPRPPLPYYTPYPMMRHSQQGSVASSFYNNNLPGGSTGVRVLPQRQFNYIPVKPNPNAGSSVLMQNIPPYVALPNRISERNKSLPTLNKTPAHIQRSRPHLETIHHGVANDCVILTPQTGSQCHVEFTDSVGYSKALGGTTPRQRPPVPVEMRDDTRFGTDPEPDRTSEVLDPTIPQKLTMKNCRLQAGPVLASSGSSEGGTKEPENPNAPYSRTRTYICAEKGCKNPGVRICGSCQSVIYCSETCQLKHWDLKHKAECTQLRELRG